jgi:hypothetical protein
MHLSNDSTLVPGNKTIQRARPWEPIYRIVWFTWPCGEAGLYPCSVEIRQLSVDVELGFWEKVGRVIKIMLNFEFPGR